MYLLNLDNQAYFYITLIFAVIFGVAYYCRKTSDKPYSFDDISLYGFGLLEFVVYAMVGAKFGVSGVIYVTLANILATLLLLMLRLRSSCIRVFTSNNWLSIVLCLIFCMLLVASVGIFAKLSHALVGFKFANGALAVSLFGIICVLVGGKRCAIYNARWLLVMSCIVVGVGIAFALQQNGVNLLSNLTDLANNQGRILQYYSGIHFNLNAVLGIILSGVFLFVIRYQAIVLVTYSSISRIKIILHSLLPIILSAIFAFVGLISIATPNATSNQGNSVTLQAQLPDGQTAYIVKSIENSSGKHINPNPGLLPPILDAQTNLPIAGAYEYALAANSMLQHYLPKQYVVFAFIILMLMLIVSLANYGLAITRIISKLLIHYFPICDSNELARSWTWRVVFVVACLIGVIIAFFVPVVHF